MAYFLGSDVKVTLTVEHATYGLHVTSGSGRLYELAAASGAPTYGIGPMTSGALSTSGTGLLNDVTGLDLGIGAMDEDVSYLGHRTPLKAEVHKETTVSLTLKRKNAIFDVIYSGDSSGNIGRWGVGTNTGADTLGDGLSEPCVTYGFRLCVEIKSGKEVFTVKNAGLVGHTVSLNADGTQEETLEFSSQVEPVIDDAVYATATTEAEL